jgi:hypothetical protein
MELSPARQKLLFVVIVVVLAALGYYLVLPALRGSSSAKAATTTGASASPTAAAAPAAPMVTVTPAATQSPAGGAFNIYDWLPFTEQDLISAASVATQFSVDYETYTYTESASAYIGKLNSMIYPPSGLAAELETAYMTPGTAGLRTGQRQISSATATINQLRAFGQQSLTFVVTINQHVVSDKATVNGGNQFAVTLVDSAGSWQVNDIELASEGNS